MKKATSAGGIIVKKEGDKYYLLLLYYSEYKDLGFLKGHVKEGETIEEDAIREMNEETGLQNISIINKIGSLIRESVEDNGETVLKTIHMYLMESQDFNHGDKAEEKYGWYEYDEAIERMAFKEEAEVLRKHKEAMTKQADNMN